MSLQLACNLTEGKSFGGRRAFANEKAILMSTLVRLIGSLRTNLDKKMIAQAVSDYDGLKEEFKDALFGILGSFQKGKITAEVMETLWHSEIKNAWEKAYGLGVRSVGNPFGIWEQDKTWLKGAEAEEFGYLGRFVEDIKENALVMGIEDRLSMYTETLDGVFHHGKVDGSPEFVKIRWILREARHCDDCIRLAAGGPYTKKTLPAVPRDGTSRCLSNCRCELRFEYADEKPRPEMYVIKGPKLVVPPQGYRLPSDNERDKLGQMSSEIDRLRGMISATSGDQKKELIRMRRDLNADMIDFMEKHKIYYVPGGQMQKVKFVESIVGEVKKGLLLEGGPGSGHFGHKGRPGTRGGSLAGGGISARVAGSVSSTGMARYLIGRHSRGRYTGIQAAATRIQDRFPGQTPDRYGRALKRAGYSDSDISKTFTQGSINAGSLARTSRRPDAVIGAKPGAPSFTVGQPVPGGKVSVADLDAAVKAAAGKNGFGVQTRGTLYNIEHYFSKGSDAAGSIGYSLEERGTSKRVEGYIGGFFLNSRSQGKGLGGDVIGAIAKKILESGGGRLELYANGQEGIGHYAWAVMGFDFGSRDFANRAGESFKSYLMGKGVSVANLSFKHSWEIAAFAEGGTKHGKKFLIGHLNSYNATLDVSPNSAGMRVLANYLSGRAVKGKVHEVRLEEKEKLFDKDSAEFHAELFNGEDAIIAGIQKMIAKGKRKASIVKEITSEIVGELIEGGPGSGHFGHKGRPGHRGGSLSGGTVAPHGVGDWAVKGKVMVSASMREKSTLYKVLSLVPGKHLKKSGIKTITVMNSQKEVNELYFLRSGDKGQKGFKCDALYDHNTGEMVLSPGSSHATILHEFAHSIRGAGMWKKKVWDGNASTGSVSRYGKTNMDEGFSEAYAHHVLVKDSLKSRAPEVSKAMEEFFEK